jgi:two-component system, OmpR family, phosphate regulon response regulator PhoB
MLPQPKTVAILMANPALSSILTMTLAAAPSLRVRAFESELALRNYLRIASADLVVTDFDSTIIPELRDDAAASRPQVVALAARALPLPPGVDEIILKPMSPRYLLERVLARLAKPRLAAPARPGLHKRDWSKFGDNIVPLFGQQPN